MAILSDRPSLKRKLIKSTWFQNKKRKKNVLSNPSYLRLHDKWATTIGKVLYLTLCMRMLSNEITNYTIRCRLIKKLLVHSNLTSVRSIDYWVRDMRIKMILLTG